MFFARRTAVLRLTSMAALVVSAVLTADHMHPERAFCPLAEACAAAAGSVLGSFNGVPTSVLGMFAFGLLFLVTLLPVEWARPLLMPAGLIAAIAGVGFFAYQHFFLESYCPLCLVADGAGFLAGAVTLTWPVPPIMRDGSRLPGEYIGVRLRWTLAAMLVTAAPFVWPRSEEPGWVEVTPLSELAFEDELDPEAAPEEPVAPAAKAEPVNDSGVVVLSMAPNPDAPPIDEPEGTTAVAADPSGATPDGADPQGPADSAPEAAGPKAKVEPEAAPEQKRKAPTGPLLVEYLNAYCPHCRKTHKRLEQVLAANEAPLRKRRVYTWAKGDYPLWARACAFAQGVGLEDEMFAELLKTRTQAKHDVYGAARRAGLDMTAFERAMNDAKPPKRLVRDRRLVQRARIRMLPTLDVGRRRLQGEQSTAELREALQVAVRDYGKKE